MSVSAPAAPEVTQVVRVKTATYDRQMLKPRILHFGFGAFARAFLCSILDETLDQAGPGEAADWGLVAVRLNSGAEELTALDATDRRFWVAAADDAGISARRIDCLVATCHPARDGLPALFSHFVHPDLSIISLTITEKGYCSRSGALDTAHPGIIADLASPRQPGTAIGVIVEGLRLRRDSGLAGVTVLPLDNLPHNGAVTRATIIGYAKVLDEDLAEWIAGHCSFPSTMVDRIVPALDEPSKQLLREIGSDDINGIVCEPFRQWVIEDDFVAQRPDFVRAGAQFVANVAPFEAMKLRMLNGAHSFLAYLGALAGKATISDCMADPLFAKAAGQLMMREQAPTLEGLQGIDLKAYSDDLLTRFGNSRLKHRTTQIAMDGSQKLPQRLLASIRQHRTAGTPFPLLALAVAGWMAYVRGTDEAGNPVPVKDPMADRFSEIVATVPDGPGYVAAMLELSEIFPDDLAHDALVRAAITDSYRSLRENGARTALTALLS
ncbi:MAG: mannitol dehydrogenase family protein [Pannonibacter sp.]